MIENKDILWGQAFLLNIPVGTNQFKWDEAIFSKSLKSVYNLGFKELLHEKIISGELKAYEPGTNKQHNLQELKNILTYDRPFLIEDEKQGLSEGIVSEEFIYQDMKSSTVSISIKIDSKNNRISTTIKSIIVSYAYPNSNFETPYLNKVEVRF